MSVRFFRESFVMLHIIPVVHVAIMVKIERPRFVSTHSSAEGRVSKSQQKTINRNRIGADSPPRGPQRCAAFGERIYSVCSK